MLVSKILGGGGGGGGMVKCVTLSYHETLANLDKIIISNIFYTLWLKCILNELYFLKLIEQSNLRT